MSKTRLFLFILSRYNEGMVHNDTFEGKKMAALELIRKIHNTRTRMGGAIPDWYHLARVSRLLEITLNKTREGTAKEREAIVLAGFGHDALEDTNVSREELEYCMGREAMAFIEGMTNTLGDDHPEPYVQQVVNAEEEVKLIKLADLYDNYTSVLYGLFTLGVAWAEGYFLPIVQPMFAALLPVHFQKYPATAERLKNMVQLSRELLLEELERYKNDPPKSAGK